jgi:hypothetical protein
LFIAPVGIYSFHFAEFMPSPPHPLKKIYPVGTRLASSLMCEIHRTVK